MFETLKQSFAAWSAKSSDRVKLQHTYIVLAVALLVVAGVIGLMNRELGQNVLLLAIISAGMFLINAVVWSLLQSAVLSRVPSRRSQPGKTKK